jgi:GLPGLI family protein
MKRIILPCLFLFAFPLKQLSAQQKSISQAVIYTTTNIIAPEEDEQPAFQGQEGRGGMNFRNFGDGETKSTTYLKGHKVKTIMKSDMGRSTIYRDNDAKMTTTVVEAMGNKMGFFATDEEQAAMLKQMDSIRQARRKTDSTRAQQMPPSGDNPVELVPSNDTKKIAGYVCNKAYLVTTRLLGLKDSVTIWYTPELKMQNLAATGGMSGLGNMTNPNAKGFSLVNGFIMGYEMAMRRNRKMEVTVTKIELNKEISDKEFIVPEDIEIKSIKEMQGMGGQQGGMPFRRMQ